MKRFTATRASFFALVLLLVFSITGCKKEDPNPELLDGIYLDLQRRATDSQKELEVEQKNAAAAKVAIEKAEPNSIELKDAEKNLTKAEAKILALDQQAHYYKIRSERRLLVDRISYAKAFTKDEPWPDPHEYSDYQVNMRLQEAPRNWSMRVPKLQDRLSKAGVAGQKAEKKEEKSEE